MPGEIVAGGLTQAQIDKLKKKYGKLRLVTLKMEGGDEHYWFKHPNMQTMSAVAKFAESDPMKSSQIFFSNCLVKGDEGTVNDVPKFISVSPHIMDMIEKHQTEVKNF